MPPGFRASPRPVYANLVLGILTVRSAASSSLPTSVTSSPLTSISGTCRSSFFFAKIDWIVMWHHLLSSDQDAWHKLAVIVFFKKLFRNVRHGAPADIVPPRRTAMESGRSQTP